MIGLKLMLIIKKRQLRMIEKIGRNLSSLYSIGALEHFYDSSTFISSYKIFAEISKNWGRERQKYKNAPIFKINFKNLPGSPITNFSFI